MKQKKKKRKKESLAPPTFTYDEMLGFADHCYLKNIAPCYNELFDWVNKDDEMQITFWRL